MNSYFGSIGRHELEFDFTKFKNHITYIDFECLIIVANPAFDNWKVRANATRNFTEHRHIYETEYIAPPKTSSALQWAHSIKFEFSLHLQDEDTLYIMFNWVYGPFKFNDSGSLKRC
jgi:hypothetical protein